MCGLAGLLDPSGGRRGEALTEIASAMADALRHRGPDDGGVWVDAEVGVALGSRRLAVIDLSVEGHQPMASRSGRFVVAYNGEIYNHGELRARLAAVGRAFRGHSDTEVLVEAVDEWGLDATLGRLNGMFAFALWDRHERSLHLVRDRLGEKPLYYGWVGKALTFGSELKAVRAFPGFDAEVDRDALTSYLGLGYVAAPACIYRGFRQVEPATVVTFIAGDLARRTGISRRYWSASQVAAAGLSEPLRDDAESVADRLEELLSDAVSSRLQADVPVGAFLSGGIDSSLVVALMTATSPGSVRTFTVAFDDLAYDESTHAAAVASHLGTEHTELRLRAKDATDTIPKLPYLYDEPFADSSQIPTFLVSRLAREHVTVSLSGDGGDELFGGYNRHAWGGRLWAYSHRTPMAARRAAARVLAAPSPAAWDALFARAAPLLPRVARVRNPGIKMHKLAGVLPAADTDELYRTLISAWPHPERLVLGGDSPAGPRAASGDPPPAGDLASQMMYRDLVGYLPGDILVKLDRASMGVSLESRVPLLDHRVVELAWRVPVGLKIKAGTGKWILRQVLARHVPPSLFERPKAGFGLPLGSWLRGPLRDWADDMLSAGSIRGGGYLDAALVGQAWQEHRSGRRDLEAQLWPILMFQAWLDVYGHGSAGNDSSDS